MYKWRQPNFRDFWPDPPPVRIVSIEITQPPPLIVRNLLTPLRTDVICTWPLSYLLPKQDEGTCQIWVNPTKVQDLPGHPVDATKLFMPIVINVTNMWQKYHLNCGNNTGVSLWQVRQFTLMVEQRVWNKLTYWGAELVRQQSHGVNPVGGPVTVLQGHSPWHETCCKWTVC